MREPTLLELLQRHLDWRKIGNTTAVIAGADNTRDTILILRDERQKENLISEFRVEKNGHEYTINNLHLKTIFDIPKLRGLGMPVIIDHFALSALITQHTAAVNKYWRDKYDPGWRKRHESELQPPMYDSFSSDLAANPPAKGTNEKLGLPFGDGMERILVAFDVDGTLIDEDTVIHSTTLDILRAIAFQKWKNVDVIVWSGGGADYARVQYSRITKDMDERHVKFHSKLEHTELRKKYDKVIAFDDIQDTRLGDVNLIVRNK